jgi:hypothetical protein
MEYKKNGSTFFGFGTKSRKSFERLTQDPTTKSRQSNILSQNPDKSNPDKIITHLN